MKINLRPILRMMDTTVGYISYSEIKSQIMINNTKILEYNALKKMDENFEFLHFFPKSIFCLIDFKGDLKIYGIELISTEIKEGYFLYLFNSKKTLISEISISMSIFINNSFKVLVILNNFYENSSLVCIVNELKFETNDLETLFKVDHVNKLQISVDFDKYFDLPNYSLIETAHSFVFLKNCRFNNNYAASDYFLIEVNSFYQVDYLKVFTLAKRVKGEHFSNDSISIIDCIFSYSDFLLLLNTNLNYLLNIENTIFENIDLTHHQDLEFIVIISEGLFSLKNVTFNNIICRTTLINFVYYINVSLFDVTMKNISFYDKNALYFFSISEALPLEHQIIITNITFCQIFMILSNKMLGSIYSSLIYTLSESGKGPGITIKNAKIFDIFYSHPNYRHQILRLSSSSLKLEMVSVTSIMNSIFLIHEARIISAFLIIANLQVNNLFNSSIIRILDGGIGAYEKAEIVDSSFLTSYITSNRALGLNLANKIFLNNISVDILQSEGMVIYAQVRRLSFLLIKNIRIRNQINSRASLLSIVTEIQESSIFWDNYAFIFAALSNNIYVSFGIQNSTFESSFETAIIVLAQSQILLSKCRFIDLKSSGEGGVLKLKQNSKVIFHQCNFSKSYGVRAGGFEVEDSQLILSEILISHSASSNTGGVLNCFNSIILIKNSSVSHLKSFKGGFSYADNCYVIIYSSYFANSTVDGYGAFLYGKEGSILILNSTFSSGTAIKFGGGLFFEGGYLNITDSEFIGCRSNIGILFLAKGPFETTSCLMNIRLSYNYGENDGTILYLNEINMDIENMHLSNSKTKRGFLCCILGLFSRPKISIKYSLITKNEVDTGIFLIREAGLEIKFSSFNVNNVGIFNFLNSDIKISRSFISNINLDSYSTKSGLYFLHGKLSNIDINQLAANMGYRASFLICSLCKNISLSYSLFRHGFEFKGGVLLLQYSELIGDNLIFFDNKASEGGVLYAFNCKIKLESSYFLINFARLGGSDLALNNIETFPFLDTFLNNCFFFKLSNVSVKLFKSTIFINFSIIYGGNLSMCQFLQAIESKNISLMYTTLLGFSSMTPIEINSGFRIKTYLTFVSCNFTDSLAFGSEGGFLKVEGIFYFYSENCTFLRGGAKVGGAIYFNCLIELGCSILIKNNKFINNTALVIGGAIISETKTYFRDLSCEYINNAAENGKDIYFFPSKLVIIFIEFFNTNETEEFLKNEINSIGWQGFPQLTNLSLKIIPGYKITLTLVILDEKDILQIKEQNTYVTVDVINSELKNYTGVLKNNIANVYKGIAIFDKLIFKGSVNFIAALKFSYSNGKNKASSVVLVNITSCKRGDVYKDGICSKCPENFFSLEDDPENKPSHECSPCPENSNCPGGDIIIPNQYYWRKNEKSSMIIFCKFPQACPEQNKSLFYMKAFDYECQVGYEGNGCEECSKGYGFYNDSCLECGIGRTISLILLIFGLLFYYFFINSKEKKATLKNQDSELPLLKILINYFSIFPLVSNLLSSQNKFYSNLSSISVTYLTTSPKMIFSIDCLAAWQKEEKFQYGLIIICISPIFLNFIIFNLSFLSANIRIIFCKKKSEDPLMFIRSHLNIKWVFFKFLKHLTVIYLNLYTLILLGCFNIFKCYEVYDDTGDKYLQNNSWLKCESSYYQRMVLISTAFLVFWGILVPLGLFIAVLKLRVDISKKCTINFVPSSLFQEKAINFKKYLFDDLESNKRVVVNFLIRGYKSKFIWWEAVIYLRKVILILIANYSRKLDSVAFGGLGILILSISSVLTLFFKPFILDHLNVLEFLSLLASVTAISVGVILDSENKTPEGIKHLATVLLIFSHSSFIISWLYYFLRRVLRISKLKLRSLMMKLRQGKLKSETKSS